jgi:hypothetical protein
MLGGFVTAWIMPDMWRAQRFSIHILSSYVVAALQLLDAQAAAASAAKLQQQMQACHQAALQAAQQELDEQQEARKLQLEEQQLAHRRELRSLQQKLANMQARMEVQHEVRDWSLLQPQCFSASISKSGTAVCALKLCTPWGDCMPVHAMRACSACCVASAISLLAHLLCCCDH